MSICLTMIARDEADVIGATLRTVRPLVDTWCLVDTGSSDDTVAAAAEAMEGVPGWATELEWKGFAHARTAALDLARGTGADYLLMLDADHTINVHGEQPELTADSYLVPIRNGNLDWRLPLLTRASHPFRYEGAAHAYLTSDLPVRSENLDWFTVNGGGGASRAKLERDIELLTADEQTPRTVFYLARTYDDLDDHENAIVHYRRRLEMGGWEQERFYSQYRLGSLLVEHVSFSEGADHLLAAWRQHPERAEPLRALANSATHVAGKLPEPDGLFVHRTAYKDAA